ncbi:MAG: putative ribonuclease, partial [Frankiales bacterium]|nr:putative ribonuclease [Frankiales bacterium]
LPTGRRGEVPGLADSKLLTAAARKAAYDEVRSRALAWSVVVVPSSVVDAQGLHVMNVRAMRQAVARLDPCPSYVLTDGFAIGGMPAPSLAVWKGDRVAACVAAASVLAKVTRDRLMVDLHERWPAYDFARHKGYITPEHTSALTEHGPCPEHRFSYVNVRASVASQTRRAVASQTRRHGELGLDGHMAVTA